MNSLLLVNFGGPRTLEEVESFLCELLCDRELIRTPFPSFYHRWFFRRVARKRAPKVRPDYELIGGKSPIFETTEFFAKSLKESQKKEVLTFHRYLKSTHRASIEAIENSKAEKILVFPFFPQFSSATTGSIAAFFEKNLSRRALEKLQWIRSYPTHPLFVHAWQEQIRCFLKEKKLKEEESFLLFSAHGIPRSFVQKGDSYEIECNASYDAIRKGFSKAESKLCYQSKFGKGEWLRPYTDEVCESIDQFAPNKKAVVFIPLAFTSDHIETLFEIERLYLPVVKEKGFQAFRCDCFNESALWQNAINEILQSEPLFSNRSLVRKNCTLSRLRDIVSLFQKKST